MVSEHSNDSNYLRYFEMFNQNKNGTFFSNFVEKPNQLKYFLLDIVWVCHTQHFTIALLNCIYGYAHAHTHTYFTVKYYVFLKSYEGEITE